MDIIRHTHPRPRRRRLECLADPCCVCHCAPQLEPIIPPAVWKVPGLQMLYNFLIPDEDDDQVGVALILLPMRLHKSTPMMNGHSVCSWLLSQLCIQCIHCSLPVPGSIVGVLLMAEAKQSQVKGQAISISAVHVSRSIQLQIWIHGCRRATHSYPPVLTAMRYSLLYCSTATG